MPIQLYVKEASGTERAIGTISEEQLQALVDLLEEEAEGDRDYYIDKDLLDYLEQEGADAGLLALLKPLVTSEEGVEIEWRREG